MSSEPTNDDPPRSAFPPTKWSVVLRIQGNDTAAATRAMEELCGRYWYPLYSYARRRNLSPEDAEDATQTFFSRLISADSLLRVDREQGRLRSFLLGGLKHFLTQTWRNGNTLKRGRGITLVPIDTVWAEERFSMEANGGQFDDEHFDRVWAVSLLDRAMERLRLYYVGRGRSQVYESLKNCLIGDGDYGAQGEMAATLGMSEEGVRSAVHQLRQRFRRYVEEEVRETVGNASEVHEEIALLCRILAHR